MQKPHIKLINDGWWICYIGSFSVLDSGLGNTPLKAYQSWLHSERLLRLEGVRRV